MTVLDCKLKTLKHSSADVNTSFLFRERWFSLCKSYFLYNEVPIKGHKSYYRILIPQAWDQFQFKWASLYTCTYLSWDLVVICRTSTLDTWQCVHVAIPRCDPWHMGCQWSARNTGGRQWSLFLMFFETSGPWSWNVAFPKKQTKPFSCMEWRGGANGKQLSTGDRLRMRVDSYLCSLPMGSGVFKRKRLELCCELNISLLVKKTQQTKHPLQSLI